MIGGESVSLEPSLSMRRTGLNTILQLPILGALDWGVYRAVSQTPDFLP